ncbi:hypothetical protein ACLB0R_06625 [Sphingomonas sp. GlSt437]|uniref:hypothetical protein n=1 Tax=Sphingomonas sp. GlSt437 TaxID=3389970 RepID=UPI003A8A16BB
MRKLMMTMLGATALVGFAVPAAAHDQYDNSYQHDRLHDRLDRQHDRIHDRLDAIHEQAHEEGLTPWEHAQLHRELDYAHARADARLRWQHELEHRRGSWEYYNRYRPSYGYNHDYDDRWDR